VLNVEMFGNNRFFAFLSALDHEIQESGGCTSDRFVSSQMIQMCLPFCVTTTKGLVSQLL